MLAGSAYKTAMGKGDEAIEDSPSASTSGRAAHPGLPAASPAATHAEMLAACPGGSPAASTIAAFTGVECAPASGITCSGHADPQPARAGIFGLDRSEQADVFLRMCCHAQ